MPKTVEYYIAPMSPWTYLGHERFGEIVRHAGATVELRPLDLGRVFPASGGVPLGKRAPQRQAYRLLELRRFADHLGVPLNVQPRFFPVAGDDAARLLIAVDELDGTAAAMKLSGRVLRAVWADERDIADAATLGELLQELGLPERRLDDARGEAVQSRYDANTQRAIDAGVFGAPTYVIDGEPFWGQDRLDFVQRRLMAQSARDSFPS